MKKMRIIVILILACVLAVVVLQNRNPVQAHFLLWALEMPLILLLLLTAGLGFAIGLLAALFNTSGGKTQKE